MLKPNIKKADEAIHIIVNASPDIDVEVSFFIENAADDEYIAKFYVSKDKVVIRQTNSYYEDEIYGIKYYIEEHI